VKDELNQMYSKRFREEMQMAENRSLEARNTYTSRREASQNLLFDRDSRNISTS